MTPFSTHQPTHSVRQSLAKFGLALADLHVRRAAGRLTRARRIGPMNPVRLEIEQEAVRDLEDARQIEAMVGEVQP